MFFVVLDRLTDEVQQKTLRIRTFADDTVIYSEIREQVEQYVEVWRFALERRSQSKMDYLCVNGRIPSGMVW